MVYLKQEKFQSAEFHFHKATTIFRTNPDLICHLAVVKILLSLKIVFLHTCFFQAQHKCNRSEGALTLLDQALKIDSKNALCKFHKYETSTSNTRYTKISSRAGLLLHLEQYQEALIELEELRQIAPKESLVYYLLSKVSVHRFEWLQIDDRHLGSSTFEKFSLFLHVHVLEYGSRSKR